MAPRKKPSPDSVPRARTALVVLGMHRSGTSALTGVLGQMGCDLPKNLMGPAEINPKGFFESNLVTGLNEDLLASAGVTWFSFPRFPADWFASPKAAEFLERAGAVIAADYGRSHLFALKDPRLCRLLPFWRQALGDAGCQPAFVCIHRHPREVADSLLRWANYDADYGLLLWLRHVLDAEAGSRGLPRVFTSYDRLMADWAGTVRGIGKGLGLTWPRRIDTAAPGVEGFLSAELQHFSHAKADSRRATAMPDWVAQTYAILESWAARGEQAADHKRLDRIRAGLDDASPTFAGVTWRSQEQRVQVQHLQQRIAHLEGPAQQEHQAELDRSRAEFAVRIADLTTASEQSAAAAASHEINHRTEQLNRAEAVEQAAQAQALYDEARSAAATQAAAFHTEQQARLQADARIAELSAALDKAQGAQSAQDDLTAQLAAARTDAARHAANHQAEHLARLEMDVRSAQMSAALAEAQASSDARIAALEGALNQAQADTRAAQAEAERLVTDARAATQDVLDRLARSETALQTLQDAGAALEDDLRRSQDLRSAAEHEASQLRSALIQRGQEADDLHRQTAADAERLAGLEAALDAARRDHAELVRQDDRSTRHLEILTRRVSEQVRQDLENRLTPKVDHEAVARDHRALIDDYETRLTYNRKARADAEAEVARLLGEQEQVATETGAELARAEAEQAEMTRGFEALQAQILRREQEIRGLMRRLDASQSDIDTATAQVATVEAQAAAAATALQDQIGQLQGERLTLAAATEALQGRLDVAARTETDLQDRLASRQQEVAQARADIVALSAQVAGIKARAAETVGALTDKIQGLEVDREDMSRVAEGLTGNLETAARREEQLQANLHDRLQDVTQTRNDLAELTKEHKSTLRRVTLLRDEKKAYEQRLQTLAAEVEGLMGSLSWRVTRPVRAVSGVLRRVVPGRK